MNYFNKFDFSQEPVTVKINNLKISQNEKDELFELVTEFINRQLDVYAEEIKHLKK